MGFGAEMRDFVSAFQATSSVGQKISDRRAKADLTRGPTQAELDAMSGPGAGNGAIPQVSTDSTTTGSTAKVGNRGGGAFAQQAYDYYRNVGLSHPHAAGIAANLMTESGGDPRVLSGARSGDNGKSYYAGQWQNERLSNLMSFARDRGRDKPTLQDQFDFVLEEGNPQSKYMDKGAVLANELASQAKTPEAATTLYREHYERPSANDLQKRLAYLSGITDAGNYSVANNTQAAPAPDAAAAPVGAIPDASGGDQAQQDAPPDQGYSPATGIDVVPVDVTQDQGAVPQVQPWQPQLFAADGGAIPMPHYAPGGRVDPYNPSRGYTQALPTPTNDFVPRRVGQPGPQVLPAGPTPSQLAFRNIKPIVDPVQRVVTPPPPPPPARVFTDTHYEQPSEGAQRGTKVQPQRQRYYTIDPVTMKHVVYNGEVKLDPLNNWLIQGNPTGRQQWTAAPQFERGGAIPEASYAHGGQVRESWHAGAPVPGVTLIDPGTRGSYQAAHDKEYWQPAKPRKAVTSTTTSTSTTSGKGKGKGKGKGRTATVSPAPALTEDRLARDRSGTSMPSPLAAEMRDRAPAATAVAPPSAAVAAAPGAIPSNPIIGYAGVTGIPIRGAGGAPAVLPRPQQGPPMPPPPEPLGGGVTRGPTPPPFGDLAAKHSASADQQRAILQAKFPNNPIVGAIAAPPGTPMIVIPAPHVPNNASGTGHAPTPIAGPDPMRAELPPAPAVAPSAWLYGQEVKPTDYPGANVGFAQGGAIPTRESWHAGAPVPGVNLVDPGTMQADPAASADQQDVQHANVQPTKKLRDHVAIALDGGVKFLTEHFGLRGQGAIAAPQDAGNAQAGAQRFAQGEGQATPQEIQGIDSKIDPQHQLSEGDRQMTRLAKTMDWYSQRGQKKQAQAAAASLMQYGATRFSRLGSLAAAAYDEYQQTGDPKHLDHTINFLQSAYEMIPDGAKIDVAFDPQTKQLMATHINADGKEDHFAITPQELPAMISGVQDKSSYWQSVFRLADPAGARQAAGWQHADKVKQQDRAYNAQQAELRDARTAGRADATATRIDARQAAREKSAEERAIARETRQSARKDVNWETVNPLQQQADAAKTALTDDPATQSAFDQAASKLWDALPPAANRAQLMKDMGFDKSEWSYSQPAAAETPPAKYPDAKRGKDQAGNPIWVVVKDGKPYQVK